MGKLEERREVKILYGRRLWELGEERLHAWTVKLIVEELKVRCMV